MATLGDGFKSIFLAGIGAVAIGAEKGKELVDQLVSRGEMTVEQGKQINTELKHRASEVESSIRRDTLEARMSVMTPDERVEFANIVREMADKQNEREAEAAAAKVAAAAAADPAEPETDSPAATEAETVIDAEVVAESAPAAPEEGPKE